MASTDPNDVYATCTAAADYLERYGLHREGFWPGAEFTPGAPVCLYGAIAVATGLTDIEAEVNSDGDLGIDLVMDEASCPASLAVATEIQARHGEIVSIPHYSDEMAPGVADVVALLRDVAAKHQPDAYRSGGDQ